MKKESLKGYMEFFSYLPGYKLNVELSELLEAASDTAIHTFGWPIGLVLSREEFRPKPYAHNNTKGLKAIYEGPDGRFDYWTLDVNGDYYILATLFEDERKENRIFFDTRTVRITETFLRTAKLYLKLNVPLEQEMECKIEHGGLAGRVLAAANPSRLMFEDSVCAAQVISKTYKRPLQDFVNPESLKEIVFDSLKAITEMCDLWVPSKERVIDPIVDNFLNGRVG